jgi:hypothetical protein
MKHSSSGSLLSGTLLAAALALAPARPAAAASPAVGTAQGTLTMNGDATPLKYAYAIVEPDSSDKAKENVRVILSNVALSPKAVESWSERMGMDGLKAVEVLFDPEGHIISGEFRHPVKSFSATGMHEYTKDPSDAGTIAGRLKMAKTDDFFGTKYTYDATFKAAIARKEKPKAIPAAAGAAAEKSAQGKAYRVYEKALRAGDVATLKKTVTAERAKMLDDPKMAKEALPLIQMMMPKKIAILDLKTEGADAATLVVSGPGMDGKEMRGEAKMKSEGGQWKVAEESWKNN